MKARSALIFSISVSLLTFANNQAGTQASILRLKNSKAYGGMSLNKEFLSEIKQLFDAHFFIETGTYAGKTTEQAATVFPEAHSIELSRSFYLRAKNLFTNTPNIYLYQGDSTIVLPIILHTLDKEKNILFWLDSHYCPGSAKGESNTPVLQELAAIKKSGVTDAVILVDDVCCFQPFENTEPDPITHGFPTIAQLRDAILAINPHYEFLIYGDLAFAYPKNKYNVLPSELLHACTISRAFDSDNTLSIEQLFTAERTIAQVQGEEKQSVHNLLWRAGWDGAYYRLWSGLVHLAEKNFEAAYQELNHAFNDGFTSWRVSWHLAHALYHRGEINEALRHLRTIVSEKPEFFDHVNMFSHQITQQPYISDCYGCNLLNSM